MTTCLICSNAALSEFPMNDRSLLVPIARDLVQGFIAARDGTFGGIQPRRPGTCIVERCARVVEATCGSCREPSCQRCSIAAELRAAEERINAERDAELAELGLDEPSDEIIDKIVEGLCAEHSPLGPVIVEEWYVSKSFATSTTSEVVSQS